MGTANSRRGATHFFADHSEAAIGEIPSSFIAAIMAALEPNETVGILLFASLSDDRFASRLEADVDGQACQGDT